MALLRIPSPRRHARSAAPPTTPTASPPPCPAARTALADALHQIAMLQQFLATDPPDPHQIKTATDRLTAAEARAATARRAIQRHCGALLLACRTPVTITSATGVRLGTAVAELLLEPDGRWGGVLEHYPDGTPPTVPIPGSEIRLRLRATGRHGIVRILTQLPTPSRTTAIDGRGPAPFP